MALFSGQGVTPTLKGVTTNVVTLASGQVQTLSPAGWYWVKTGLYTSLQQYDPITQIWRAIGAGDNTAVDHFIYSDGVNYRIANQTGALVGALVTNGGSGYTSAPVVTASAGGSIWRAIVGGALSTTVTVTNGGTNYTYPPQVQIQAPPPGGVQATGYCTLTSSAVSSVTITNQGAGYASAPIITFVNDPREGVNGVTQGYNAAATGTLTGSQTVTAVVCLDHGQGGQTSLPTLSFSGGGGSSAAATGIMCWTITAYAAGTAGAGLAGTVAQISAEDAFPTTAAAYTNPFIQSGLVKTRNANIKAPISSGGITATGAVIYDGGIYTSSPTPLVIPTASVVTTAPVVTFTLGGTTDVSYITQT
jgi:hypothetical protein